MAMVASWRVANILDQMKAKAHADGGKSGRLRALIISEIGDELDQVLGIYDVDADLDEYAIEAMKQANRGR